MRRLVRGSPQPCPARFLMQLQGTHPVRIHHSGKLVSRGGLGYGAPASLPSRQLPKGQSMAIAFVLVVVVVGSVLFHLLSPWWWTPIASNWSYIDHTLVDHLLDHRSRLRGGRAVHGLLRLPLPPSRGLPRPLRAREQAARILADHRHRRRRRGDADPGAVRLGTTSSRSPTRRPTSRSWRSSGSGATGCPGRTAGWAVPTPG